MKIAVVFPTESEAKYFNRKDILVRYCGVGITSAAYRTTKIIHNDQPDIIIMAGIAGVYSTSQFKIGDCVLIKHEHDADLGFFYPDGFHHVSDTSMKEKFGIVSEFNCHYIMPNMPLPTAIANTTNSAISPFVKTTNVDVESMEGAPFFYVCLQESIEFYEVRAISNTANTSRLDWDIEKAIHSLTEGLNQMIDYLLLR